MKKIIIMTIYGSNITTTISSVKTTMVFFPTFIRTCYLSFIYAKFIFFFFFFIFFIKKSMFFFNCIFKICFSIYISIRIFTSMEKIIIMTIYGSNITTTISSVKNTMVFFPTFIRTCYLSFIYVIITFYKY
jgi:hypothetical protein